MANQYSYRTVDSAPSMRRRIVEFVIDNPSCTTADIKDALGIEIPRASFELSRLKREGFVDGRRVKGQRMMEWFEVDQDAARVVKVKEWTGPKIERQTWASALHWSPA